MIVPGPPPITEDPWLSLRELTAARVALGRAGGSLPTGVHLEFQLAHAQARDAVARSLDVDALKARLTRDGYDVIVVASAARDRREYLQRPDLGRRLDSRSRTTLEEAARVGDAWDAVFVIADGLSALAIERHAPPLLAAVTPRLRQEGWRIAPVVVATAARVALGDEIGYMLGAAMVAMLIGERPGLSSPDSLGVYLTYGPRPGVTDADRNCLSNIRVGGLPYELAAHKLRYLMTEAMRQHLTGVGLKEAAPALRSPAPSTLPAEGADDIS